MFRTLIAVIFVVAHHGITIAQLKDSLTEEVVITHSKVPLPEYETSKYYQSIELDKYRNRGISDLSVILQEQPDFAVIGSYSNPAEVKNLSLQGSPGEYVLILRDGVPLLDPSIIGSTIDVRNIDLSNVDRIEILPGGQSTLYGSNAVSGVINLISKKVPQNHSLTAQVSKGSYGYYDIDMSADLRLSDVVALTVGSGTKGNEGLSSAAQEAGQNTFDTDGFNSLHFNVDMKINPDSNLTFNPIYRFNAFKGDYDSGAFADGTGVYEQEYHHFGLNSKWLTKQWTHHLNLTGSLSDRIFDDQGFEYVYKASTWQADAFSTTKTANGQITVGANLQRSALDDESLDISSYDNIGLYFHHHGRWSEKLNTTVGLRFNYHNLYGSHINYEIAQSYWLTNEVKFSAALTSGYRPPLLSQLYGPFGANPDLHHENSTDISCQLKYKRGSLSASGRIYYRQISGAIAYLPHPLTNEYIYQNVQELTYHGVIGEASIQLSDQLSLRGSYTLTNGNTERESFERTFLYHVPRHQFRFGLDYAVGPMRFQVLSHHVGSRIGSYFNNFDFSISDVELANFRVYSLHTQYRLNTRFLISGSVENILNANFYEIYGYQSMGRNIRLALQYKIN